MNYSTAKLLTGFVLIICIWFVMSNWKNKVTLKEGCFKPFQMELTAAVNIRRNPIWQDDSRKETPIAFWNVPAIVRLPMFDSDKEKAVIKLGCVGYLFADSSMNNAVPLEKDTILHFSGDLIETKYTWIEQFLSGTKEITTSVGIVLGEENFLIYDFLLEPEVIDTIKSGSCSNH